MEADGPGVVARQEMPRGTPADPALERTPRAARAGPDSANFRMMIESIPTE